MPVTLDYDSIKIINPDKTYVVDTIKSTGERDGDTILNVPVVSPDYEILRYTHSGGSEDQTPYTLTFDNPTECDILIVGGGGGGGEYGGGGGGGDVIYHSGVMFNAGTYFIKVGKGGNKGGPGLRYEAGFSGNPSEIFLIETFKIIAGGGGGGNSYGEPADPLTTYTYFIEGNTYYSKGGGGGGGDGTIGANVDNRHLGVISEYSGDGGDSSGQYAGGGGGAVGNGGTRTGNVAGGGGIGFESSITGVLTQYGGGGGGGTRDIYTAGSNGGDGVYGGGNGGRESGRSATTGVNGTGGGGGGGGRGLQRDGANGGSGVVIIKRYIKPQPIPYIPYTPDYKVLTFTNDGSSQTPYTLTFDNPTECDILIVGGGGAGGLNAGGGGGAGGLVYGSGVLMNGTYNIKVGKGGVFNGSSTLDGGKYSSISNSTYNIIAKGGGSGADSFAIGNAGGSGGGGASSSSSADQQGGNSTQQTSFTFENVVLNGYGNSGGMGRREEHGGWTRAGGGGGGAGAKGNTSGDYAEDTGQGGRIAYGGDGGIGREYDITGVSKYYAGGGGGSIHNNTNDGYPGSGGLGGGGNAGQPYDAGSSGINGTGGGGGASGGGNGAGGNGGSGIVIIRYKQQYNQVPFNAQWTYSAADTSVHHYGNVGIGTTASDTTKLSIRGDVNVIGDYYKNDILLTEQWKTSSQNTNNIYREKGFVGIGTNNVDYGIHVIGQIYAGSGGITGNGSTAWTSTSDSRVKQNIVPASGQKCVENVRNINLYRFNYNSSLIDTDDKHQLGFIAQEVQQYYPKAVKTNNLVLKNNMKIDNLLSVDVTQINYTLYGTVKKLAEDINTIREKLGITEIQTDVKNLAYVRKDGEDSDGLKIS